MWSFTASRHKSQPHPQNCMKWEIPDEYYKSNNPQVGDLPEKTENQYIEESHLTQRLRRTSTHSKVHSFTIWMSFASSIMRDVDPPNNQREAWLQSMKIEPMTDPERKRNTRSASSPDLTLRLGPAADRSIGPESSSGHPSPFCEVNCGSIERAARRPKVPLES